MPLPTSEIEPETTRSTHADQPSYNVATNDASFFAIRQPRPNILYHFIIPKNLLSVPDCEIKALQAAHPDTKFYNALDPIRLITTLRNNTNHKPLMAFPAVVTESQISAKAELRICAEAAGMTTAELDASSAENLLMRLSEQVTALKVIHNNILLMENTPVGYGTYSGW